MEENDLQKLFDSLLNKDNISESDINGSAASSLTDRKFENNLRLVLEKNLPVAKYIDKVNLIKEFELFKIELFNRKTRELIKSNAFLSGDAYYYLTLENEYFFISNDDLSSLNYYNSKTNVKAKIKGFEEKQQLSDNSTTFFLQNEDINRNIENSSKNDNRAFFDDIKLNLVSRETINFIGKIDNIPKNYLDDYYVRAKLLSYGQTPYAICLGKEKESKPSTGIIHYPMENYYLKLTLRKGQFGGAYISENEFDLSTFNCEVIYNNFVKVPKDKFILFEFKNGNGGEDKILLQAVNYQENAKVLLDGAEFYHIIIIRSTKLKKALENQKDRINNKNLVNFAILCLNNKLEICGKDFKNIENAEVHSKRIGIGKKGSKKFESSISDNSLINETKEINNSLLLQIMSELREMKSEMKTMKSEMKKEIKNLHEKINQITLKLKI